MTSRTFRQFGVGLLIAAFALALTGCERDQEPSVTQSGMSGPQSGIVQQSGTQQETKESIKEETFEQSVARAYAYVLDHIDIYHFEIGPEPEPEQLTYTYVLAEVEGSQAPLLLVDRNTGVDLSNFRVFLYNENHHSVDDPAEVLMQGAEVPGFFIGGPDAVVGQSPYLQYLVTDRMQGNTTIERIDVVKGQVRRTTLWEGLFDQVPASLSDDLEFADLEWTDVSDKSLLEEYAGGLFETDEFNKADGQLLQGNTDELNALIEEKEDAGMVVLEGTIQQFDHDELVAFQELDDIFANGIPKYDGEPLYTMLILPREQVFEFPSASGDGPSSPSGIHGAAS